MNICVTGASRGIGAALTRHLLASGHRVWGVARDENALRVLAAATHDSCFRWSRVDLFDPASLTAWGEEMRAAQFEPDMVILNAAVYLNDMEHGFDLGQAEKNFNVNLNGALRCVDLFLPEFLARKSGTFLAIASTAALRPSLLSASYAASKAGLAMAFRSLRLRFAPEGVAFKVAYLGPIATEMWEGKKKHVLIPQADEAATALAAFALSRSGTLYYPFLSTLILRLTLWMPDRWFAYLSKKFLK